MAEGGEVGGSGNGNFAVELDVNMEDTTAASSSSSVKAEQLEHCMQLLILYEARTLSASERTGSKLKNCYSGSHSESEVILELRDDNNGETG